jgi:rare lipoprotein A (peptidoglycan hydrolase)
MARRFLPLTMIAPGLVLGGCGGLQSAFDDLQTISPATSGPAAPGVASSQTPAAGPQVASTLPVALATVTPPKPTAQQVQALRPHYVLGKPYQFDGTWYRPAVDYEYDESGIAALYAPNAGERTTTNGEAYDPAALAAAHKTLPLPSMVRVTNEQNGKAVELRVNDRGPFVSDRLIQLTPAAAAQLGIGSGEPAKVRVEVMAAESRALASELGIVGGAAEERLPAVPAPKLSTEPLPGKKPTQRALPLGTDAAELPVPAAPAAPQLATSDIAPLPQATVAQAPAATLTPVPRGPQIASAEPVALAAPATSVRYIIGRSYQFDGVWYRPAADYDYDETGHASVYVPGSNGQHTTDGEVYDDGALSAAHKTLPLPSMVLVTNTQTGQSVQLRVNDRGPFADDRVIQLSRHAAELLGIEHGAIATVRVQVMAEESRRLAASFAAGQANPAADEPTPAFWPVVRSPAQDMPASGVPTNTLPAPLPPGVNTAEIPAGTPAAITLAPPPLAKPQAISLPVAAPQIATADQAPPATYHVRMGPQVASLVDVPLPEPPALPPAPAAASIPYPMNQGDDIVSFESVDFDRTLMTLDGRPAVFRIAVPAPAAAPTLGAQPSRPLGQHSDGAPAMPELQAAATGGKRIFVQVGAFLDSGNAQRLQSQLAALGETKVVAESSNGRLFNCVRVGPLATKADARSVLTRMAALGYSDALLIGE